MQAGMGLLPPSLATMYSARHPGDAAMAFSQQAKMQSQQLIAQGMQMRMISPLTTAPPLMQIGNAPLMPLNPAVPNVLSGMGPPSNMYPPIGPAPGFSPTGAAMSPYASPAAMAAPRYSAQATPFLPFPLSPQLPGPQFNTPYSANYAREEQFNERAAALAVTGGGVAARIGTDLLGGAIGARYGGRWGGALGFAAAEFSGGGQFGQDMWMNTFGASGAASVARTASMMNYSQGFVNSGQYMAASGAGFSHHAAQDAVQQMTQLASSSNFRGDTGNRFNTNDVFRIAQNAGENGLLAGTSNPEEMTARVRDVAKSLRLVMDLANEPDVRQAIQSMGSLRGMGLNLAQTTDAVAQGRSFARMAGTTFQSLAASGGAMGAQTYQSMGLTQGQGFISGMANVGSAMASVNQGVLNPQIAALVGGAQGYGAMNTAFSGQFLQLPMVAAAMLNGRGGMNAGSIQDLMSGRSNMFSMAGSAANNLGGMTSRYGVAGLGMALGMQGLAQDTLSAAMTPEQQRIMQDRQLFGLAHSMGMRGSQGYMTAAQIAGMDGRQAMARLQELSDPRYHSRVRGQIETDRRNEGSYEAQQRQNSMPGFLDNLRNDYGFVGSMGRGWDNAMRSISGFFGSISGSDHLESIGPRSREEAMSYRRFMRSRDFGSMMSRYGRSDEEGVNYAQRVLAAEIHGAGGLLSHTTGALATHAVSDDRIRGMLAEARYGATATTHLLNASDRDERRARRSLSTAFGSQAGADSAISNIAGDVANAYNRAGTAFGSRSTGDIMNGILAVASSEATFGMATPTSGAARVRTDQLPDQIRQSIVRQLRRQSPNMSSQQLNARANELMPQVMDAASSEARLFMTRQGYETAFNAQTRGARADNSVAGMHAAGERATNEAYQHLLGNTGSYERNSLIQGAREFTGGEVAQLGYGRSTEQREQSRSLMAAMAAAHVVAQRSAEDSPERQRAVERLRQLNQIAQQRFGSNARDIREAAIRQSEHLQGNSDARGAAERAVATARSGEEMMNAFGGANRAEQFRHGAEAMGEGFARVSRLSGGIVQLVNGIQLGGEHSVEQLQDRLSHVDAERVRALQHSSIAVEREFGRRLSDAQRSGDYGSIQEFFAGQGEGRAQARSAFEARRRGVGGLWNRINPFSNDRFHDTFEDYEGRTTAAGGRADVSAMNRTAEAQGMEREAGSEGLMEATDAFQRAISEFRDAVREMRGNNDSQTMNNLVGGGDN